jgi:hypothetical protein
MARKKANIHYLYKTTCLVTGRYYIGMHSTSNLEDGYMGSGKRLRYSIRKYGIDNHNKEILGFFESRELLIEAEKEAITPEMLIDRDCMNLAEGGSSGFDYIKYLRKNNPKYDIFWREMQSNRLSVVHKLGLINYNTFEGRQHKEETKQLMSDKAKLRVGKANSQYGTCWITRNGVNKKIKKEDLEHWLNEGWVQGRK